MPVAEARVSVVIPTRNRIDLLPRTLGSVLAQRDVELEVIVVDEASTDGTAEYIQGLRDPRLTVIRHERPRGVAEARNAGLRAAKARWVAFLDDDDIWAPTKLADQLNALAASPGARWSCVGAVTINPRLRVLIASHPPEGPWVAGELLPRNRIPGGGSGVVVDAELIRALGGFDTQLSNLADWDMWLRLSLVAPLAVVDAPLVGYLRHRRSLSHDASGMRRELDHINVKHATTRTAWGLTDAGSFQQRWVANMHVRAGRRVEPVRIYLRLARRGDGRALVRAVLLGMWPPLIAVIDWHARRRVPVGWRIEAEAWLAAHPHPHVVQRRPPLVAPRKE